MIVGENNIFQENHLFSCLFREKVVSLQCDNKNIAITTKFKVGEVLWKS